jgi:serine/threonine protein kinase
MAPEIHKGQKDYDERSDIWSYAMLLLEMLTLERPYSNLRRDTAISYIMDGLLPFSLDNFKSKNPLVVDLILGCAKKHPQDRLTAEQIIQKISLFS